MSNGKKPVRDSKGKIVKNLYQKADSKKTLKPGTNKTAYELARERKINARLSTDDLIRSANALKGVEISKNVTTGVLKSLGNKIAKQIPLTGSKIKD